MLAAYGVVRGILKNSELASNLIYANTLSLIFNFVMKIAIVKSGNDLTDEALKTSVLISKIMNEFDHSESQKTDFMFLITQVKARNVNVKNKMFTINWKLLLAVS